jgi:hypothetical protein
VTTCPSKPKGHLKLLLCIEKNLVSSVTTEQNKPAMLENNAGTISPVNSIHYFPKPCCLGNKKHLIYDKDFHEKYANL